MNTHKTYVAYDAQGILDHENSNLYIFHQLHAWQRMHPDRFHFLNMDQINFSSEHDDLVDSTVKNLLLSIMAKADNLLVIVSKRTNVESPILNWQISKAVNRYHLPVIIAYVDKKNLEDTAVEEGYRRRRQLESLAQQDTQVHRSRQCPHVPHSPDAGQAGASPRHLLRRLTNISLELDDNLLTSSAQDSRCPTHAEVSNGKWLNGK